MEDNTPIDELLFELEVGMCERFTALSPLHMRHERADHVFRMVKEYSIYAKKEKKKTGNGGKQVIRRPAPDTWF